MAEDVQKLFNFEQVYVEITLSNKNLKKFIIPQKRLVLVSF